MDPRIDTYTAKIFPNFDAARVVAEALQEGDPEWTYSVCHSYTGGFNDAGEWVGTPRRLQGYTVDVFDEEGEFKGSWPGSITSPEGLVIAVR